MNKLDLVKVGRSFGFSTPPRVNLIVGPGGGKGNAAQKRKHHEAASGDEESASEDEGEEEQATSRSQGRQGKQRRIETLGKKSVDRELYRKVEEQRAQKRSGQQWSR